MSDSFLERKLKYDDGLHTLSNLFLIHCWCMSSLSHESVALRISVSLIQIEVFIGRNHPPGVTRHSQKSYGNALIWKPCKECRKRPTRKMVSKKICRVVEQAILRRSIIRCGRFCFGSACFPEHKIHEYRLPGLRIPNVFPARNLLQLLFRQFGSSVSIGRVRRDQGLHGLVIRQFEDFVMK